MSEVYQQAAGHANRRRSNKNSSPRTSPCTLYPIAAAPINIDFFGYMPPVPPDEGTGYRAPLWSPDFCQGLGLLFGSAVAQGGKKAHELVSSRAVSRARYFCSQVVRSQEAWLAAFLRTDDLTAGRSYLVSGLCPRIRAYFCLPPRSSAPPPIRLGALSG